MAEDDIYGSKKRYENLTNQIGTFSDKPKFGGKTEYFCRNKNNLKYFYQLCKTFETKDLSYIRRIRVLHTLKLIILVSLINLVTIYYSNLNFIRKYSNRI